MEKVPAFVSFMKRVAQLYSKALGFHTSFNPGSLQPIMPYLQRQFSHSSSCTPDRRQVQASYIFCVGLRLVNYVEYVHLCHFELLMLIPA
jgi:hypothetical protein